MDIYKRFENVSFRNGKFLSDKSYAYDTVYFIVRFIRDYSENGKFDLARNKVFLSHYVANIFNKDPDNADIVNYYNEVLNVLEYSKSIVKIRRGLYEIVDYDLINFICLKMENAYIYLYLLAYYTLKNGDLLQLYKAFCFSDNQVEKLNILRMLNASLCDINPSVHGGPEEQWAKQNTKYIINVMNFINFQKPITRTLSIDVDSGVRNPEMISVNVAGTKTIQEKNNDYLFDFDFNYVDRMLDKFILKRGVDDDAI